MGHRTQITLEDEQYERLRAESRRSGLGLAELVRRALDQAYGTTTSDEVRRSLDASFGAWDDRDYDGAEYVDRLRGGMSRRLAS
jgi:Ribbon-helix-helix protein, copG family